MADYGSFNKVVLIGRIATEIKSKESGKGTPVASFKIATNELYRNEKKPRPSFHRVVCFGDKADMVVEFGDKGRLTGVEGKLHERSWTDEKGQMHSLTEVAAEQVIFMTAREKKEEKPQEKEASSVEEEGEPFEKTEREPGEDDDPF